MNDSKINLSWFDFWIHNTYVVFSRSKQAPPTPEGLACHCPSATLPKQRTRKCEGARMVTQRWAAEQRYDESWALEQRSPHNSKCLNVSVAPTQARWVAPIMIDRSKPGGRKADAAVFSPRPLYQWCPNNTTTIKENFVETNEAGYPNNEPMLNERGAEQEGMNFLENNLTNLGSRTQWPWLWLPLLPRPIANHLHHPRHCIAKMPFLNFLKHRDVDYCDTL